MSTSNSNRPYPANWLDDRTAFSYRDPFSLEHGSLSELSNSAKDKIHVGHSTEPSEHTFTGLHDTSEHVICPDVFCKFRNNAAPFIAARSDVVLTGYRTFLARDLTYMADESFSDDTALLKFGLAEQFQNELTGFVATGVPGQYVVSSEGKTCAAINEPVIFLGCDEAFNYGGFTIWALPKIIDTMRLEPSIKILLPVLGHTLGFLECAGLDVGRVIPQDLNCIYGLERAIIPGARSRNFWLDGETLAFFDAVRMRIGEERRHRKLYISRREFRKSGDGQAGRYMMNEELLIPELVKRDFEIIEPQLLSPSEQIRLFSSSAMIVGAAGSALFNSVYCSPDTKLISIESEPHWAAHHARLFQSRGLDYVIFEGTPSQYDFSIHHQPYTVDIPRLLDRIDRLARH